MLLKSCFGDITDVTCIRQEHEAVLMFEKLNYCDTFSPTGSFSDSEMTLVSNRIIQIRWVLPVSCRVQ